MWPDVGEDSVYVMITELSALADECIEKMKENQEIVMTETRSVRLLRMPHVAIYAKRNTTRTATLREIASTERDAIVGRLTTGATSITSRTGSSP